MYFTEALSLKSYVTTAGKTKLCPQRRSTCPRIQFPIKKMTTRCFVDDHELRRGVSVHHRLMAVAPSPPWALTGDYGSSGILTLERPKMDMSQKSPSKSLSPPLDHGGDSKDGGDGGDIGGGSGGDGGGVNDDDQYRFDEDENDDDLESYGLFGIRVLVPEVFDRISMNAVLSEWAQMMKNVPEGLRRACEMGLLSSAEMTRFFWFDTRPSLARLFVRLLPRGMSTDFYAKTMVDPALPWKLVWEVACSIGWSVWLDLEDCRGGICEWNDLIKREWHLMLAKAVKNAAFNSFVVFSLAPSSDFAGLQNLPNNVFEKSRRFREFDMQKRAASFFHKAVSLFALGFAAKVAAQIRLLTVTHRDRLKEKISIGIIANLSKEALAAGLTMGLLTNLRYQLMWGIDRRLDLHFDATKVSLAFCLALRFLNVGIGAQSFLIEDICNWLGLNNVILARSLIGDTSNNTPTVAC